MFRTGTGANRPCVRVPKLAFPVLLVMIAAFSLSVVSADDGTGITLGSGAITVGNQVYFGSYDDIRYYGG